jgi:hypothetical protein
MIERYKDTRGRCPLKLPQQGNDSPAPRNFRGTEYRVEASNHEILHFGLHPRAHLKLLCNRVSAAIMVIS